MTGVIDLLRNSLAKSYIRLYCRLCRLMRVGVFVDSAAVVFVRCDCPDFRAPLSRYSDVVNGRLPWLLSPCSGVCIYFRELTSCPRFRPSIHICAERNHKHRGHMCFFCVFHVRSEFDWVVALLPPFPAPYASAPAFVAAPPADRCCNALVVSPISLHPRWYRDHNHCCLTLMQHRADVFMVVHVPIMKLWFPASRGIRGRLAACNIQNTIL